MCFSFFLCSPWTSTSAGKIKATRPGPEAPSSAAPSFQLRSHLPICTAPIKLVGACRSRSPKVHTSTKSRRSLFCIAPFPFLFIQVPSFFTACLLFLHRSARGIRAILSFRSIPRFHNKSAFHECTAPISTREAVPLVSREIAFFCEKPCTSPFQVSRGSRLGGSLFCFRDYSRSTLLSVFSRRQKRVQTALCSAEQDLETDRVLCAGERSGGCVSAR